MDFDEVRDFLKHELKHLSENNVSVSSDKSFSHITHIDSLIQNSKHVQSRQETHKGVEYHFENNKPCLQLIIDGREKRQQVTIYHERGNTLRTNSPKGDYSVPR